MKNIIAIYDDGERLPIYRTPVTADEATKAVALFAKGNPHIKYEIVDA
jgi:hypothetical protein